MFEALRFGLEIKEKRLQFFPNFRNVLHVNDISVINISMPRLFSLLTAVYITIV